MTEKHAVVFDDDEIFRILFARILKSKNIQVTSYPSPCLYTCIQSEADTCPHAIPCADFLLTDQIMPDMTGLEFLRHLKRMKCKIPDKHKAITSEDWTEEELEEAMQLSIYAFHKSDAKEQISLWIEQSYF